MPLRRTPCRWHSWLALPGALVDHVFPPPVRQGQQHAIFGLRSKHSGSTFFRIARGHIHKSHRSCRVPFIFAFDLDVVAARIACNSRQRERSVGAFQLAPQMAHVDTDTTDVGWFVDVMTTYVQFHKQLFAIDAFWVCVEHGFEQHGFAGREPDVSGWPEQQSGFGSQHDFVADFVAAYGAVTSHVDLLNTVVT